MRLATLSVYWIFPILNKIISKNMKLACWEDPRSCFQKVENNEIPLASGLKFGEKHVFGRFWWTRKMELNSVKKFSGGSDFNN
jgi:hypothetical protein